jgi:hypothetical protein
MTPTRPRRRSPRLKDAVDLDAIQADLAGVVAKALEPAHVSLWMSERT